MSLYSLSSLPDSIINNTVSNKNSDDSNIITQLNLFYDNIQFSQENILWNGSLSTILLFPSEHVCAKNWVIKTLGYKKNELIIQHEIEIYKHLFLTSSLQNHFLHFRTLENPPYTIQNDINKSNNDSINNSLCLFLERCQLVDFFDIIYNTGPLPEKFAFILFKKVLDCVEYMHSLNVAHLDLKLEQILIDQYYNIKLSDFGLANHFNPLERNTILFKNRDGTADFQAPEIRNNSFRHAIYLDGPAIDVWGLGSLLFITLFGVRAFNSANSEKCCYYRVWSNGSNKYKRTFWKWIRHHLKDKARNEQEEEEEEEGGEEKEEENKNKKEEEQKEEKKEEQIQLGKEKIRHIKYNNMIEITKLTHSNLIKDIFYQMLHPSPEHRISISEIRKHPWYLKFNSSSNFSNSSSSSSSSINSINDNLIEEFKQELKARILLSKKN